ncbi:X-ray repair cross-complementing 5-like [Brachionus plicatilis]|uniref:X-ray repair cross-complementing 5-like n=1 Tax=Brachionus plicatilis TaxID=10195 RepID=A0A3M7SUM5_BRAPC|nr:X-ray repair cross-complementing 5-like [Brachionus plicatilis]
MSKNEIEGLVLVLDIGESMSTKVSRTTTYLQSCVDIIQMIVQRKMFQSSKDEIGLVAFGCDETDNELWDGSSDDYRHVSVVRCLSIVDWEMLDYLQNRIAVSNIRGDVLDGILVALNHFVEDRNKKKVFKEKRVIVLTDFSSCSNDDSKLQQIGKTLAKQAVRLDVISPFSEEDTKREEKPNGAEGSSADANEFNAKQMTIGQIETLNLLNNLCDQAGGCLFSFNETLSLLSTYQARTIKSSGTKYQMTIGEKFSLPIVSMIKCKENKPEIFRFKKVFAKDENVELKIDRARFTKDDEQRDLNDKTDTVDAFKYGSTYVPIDSDTVSLKLQVEKCFNILGFTKSQNVHRHYFLGDSVNQILPDPNAGAHVEEAFANMARAMYEEDVCGIVRKVFNSRSSPEMGCLIPYLTKETTCLLYISLPFDDDLKKITLENFFCLKKFKPTEKQLNLIDDLIDCMDLSKKSDHDEEEAYDPHLTFNPYIQRMFQSIALRATNPSEELPHFQDHITNSHLTKIGNRIRNDKTQMILKRCLNEFPMRELAKKSKKNEENIFEKTKIEDKEEIELISVAEENLTDILESGLESKKVKKVGTVNPVEDFKILAEKIISSNTEVAKEEFEEICLQIQEIIRDLFEESLRQANSFNDADLNDMTVFSFQEKSFNCVKIMRHYSLKLNFHSEFNAFLKTLKIYLVNESLKIKMTKYVENFWRNFFMKDKLGLISNLECSDSNVSEDAAEKFLSCLIENANNDVANIVETKEEVEDLLDLM